VFIKKQRLQRLTKKLEGWEEQVKQKRPKITFGTNKLFHKQFHSLKNDHQQWKKEWIAARDYNFSLLGSKDETCGNQTCQLRLKEASFNLKLRFPNSSEDKYLTISNIRFSYGEKKLKEILETKTALFFRFLRDKKSWKLFVTFEYSKPETLSKKDIGAIGMDINIDHLAIAETDRFGNLISSKRIPLVTYGKSKHQTLAAIGEASKELVALAEKSKKPIILEKLDFKRKRADLGKASKRLARMLSSFAYSKIILYIKARAFKAGIEVFQVNPAYSSVIGKIKYANQYGLSTHQSAALVISRRFYKFSERLPNSKKLKISWTNGDYEILDLPVRNRFKHIWSTWASLSRELKTRIASYYRKNNPLVGLGPPVVTVLRTSDSLVP